MTRCVSASCERSTAAGGGQDWRSCAAAAAAQRKPKGSSFNKSGEGPSKAKAKLSGRRPDHPSEYIAAGAEGEE